MYLRFAKDIFDEKKESQNMVFLLKKEEKKYSIFFCKQSEKTVFSFFFLKKIPYFYHYLLFLFYN